MHHAQRENISPHPELPSVSIARLEPFLSRERVHALNALQGATLRQTQLHARRVIREIISQFPARLLVSRVRLDLRVTLLARGVVADVIQGSPQMLGRASVSDVSRGPF